jgi:hypothetical protein
MVLPDVLRAELRERRSEMIAMLRTVDSLHAEYDVLLARFRSFPDTTEAVASAEWSEAVDELNRTLVELKALGSPATDAEVVCGFAYPSGQAAP